MRSKNGINPSDFYKQVLGHYGSFSFRSVERLHLDQRILIFHKDSFRSVPVSMNDSL